MIFTLSILLNFLYEGEKKSNPKILFKKIPKSENESYEIENSLNNNKFNKY